MIMENPTPQAQLRHAHGNLAKSLRMALDVMLDGNATPASVNVAMGALAQAQQAWNAAANRIPISVMTYQPQDEGRAEQPAAAVSLNPFGSTDAHTWAKAFMAHNQNTAVDFDSLVGWFSNAIETGRTAGIAAR